MQTLHLRMQLIFIFYSLGACVSYPNLHSYQHYVTKKKKKNWTRNVRQCAEMPVHAPIICSDWAWRYGRFDLARAEPNGPIVPITWPLHRCHGFKDWTHSLFSCGSQVIPDLNPSTDRARLYHFIRDRNVAYVDHHIQISTLEHEVFCHDLAIALPPDKNSIVKATLVLDRVQGILIESPTRTKLLAFFLLWPFCAWEVSSPTPTSHMIVFSPSLIPCTRIASFRVLYTLRDEKYFEW